MKTRSIRHNGFTLMELLIVIAIIALLSAVSLAALNGIRAKAKRSAAVQTLRTLGQAVEVYAGDNKGVYPGEAGGAVLAEAQTVQLNNKTMLVYFLEEYLTVDEEENDEAQDDRKYLIDFAPNVAHPYIEKDGEGPNREVYYLFHVSTDLEDPQPGPSSIDSAKSVWGRPKASIAFSRVQVPMLSDIYLSAKWDDYKEDDVQTFWGKIFNVLYFDGHVDTLKADKFDWIEVIPNGN